MCYYSVTNLLLILYVKEHIPCRMLSKFTFEKESEAFAIKISLRKV